MRARREVDRLREHEAGLEHLFGRQSPLGPVDPSFRALSGRLKFTVRRHKFNKDSLSLKREVQWF